MKCPYCSSEVQDSVTECSQCGAALDDTVQSNLVPNNSIQNVELPMKWYKYLIYFSLFANAVLRFADGILCLIGIDGGAVSEVLFEGCMFTGEYRAIDIVYGIVCIVMAGVILYVRNKLAKFKEDAPRLYIIYDIISAVFSFTYNLLIMVILENAEISSIIGEIIGAVVGESLYVYLNVIYFKKRKHLFVNK